MMQLEFGGTQYPIAAGETVIGAAPDCAVVLAGDGVQPRHALVQGSPGGAAVRAAVPEAAILVNGVPVGADRVPVLHGDKIQIGPHELVAVDSERAGRTRLFDARAFDVAGPAGAAPQPAGASGGRLVCLTDGREYAVGELLVFGRDASADVVVTGSEVSRRHAEIRLTAEGYLLADASANGTYVNGVRIERPRLLARSDVIRVGDDEFRFYADTAAAAPAVPLGTVPPGAAYRLSDTMHGMPAAELSAAPPTPLASFLVRSGEQKGRRLLVKAPGVNIGRADYNDVVIADPSVSTAHAKLQRRDGLWMLTDSGSTNGTYVDGELVHEDTPVMAGASVRFGDVTLLFEPHDERIERVPLGGTRLMDRSEMFSLPAGPNPEPPPRPLRPPRPRPEPRQGVPGWLIAAIVLAAAAAGAAAGFVLLR